MRKLPALALALALFAAPVAAQQRGNIWEDVSPTSVPNTSTQVLALDNNRNALMMCAVDATNDVWVNLAGGTAAANAAGSILLTHASFQNGCLVLSVAVPRGVITAISSASTAKLTIYVMH